MGLFRKKVNGYVIKQGANLPLANASITWLASAACARRRESTQLTPK